MHFTLYVSWTEKQDEHTTNKRVKHNQETPHVENKFSSRVQYLTSECLESYVVWTLSSTAKLKYCLDENTSLQTLVHSHHRHQLALQTLRYAKKGKDVRNFLHGHVLI